MSLHLSDLTRLVVTTKNGDSLGVAHFQGNEQSHCLNWVVTTIDVVTHEKVVGAGRFTTNFEKFSQIVELAVDITANGHWRLNTGHVGLLYKNFFSLRKKWKFSTFLLI